MTVLVKHGSVSLLPDDVVFQESCDRPWRRPELAAAVLLSQGKYRRMVTAHLGARRLTHGIIIRHGTQLIGPEFWRWPSIRRVRARAVGAAVAAEIAMRLQQACPVGQGELGSQHRRQRSSSKPLLDEKVLRGAIVLPKRCSCAALQLFCSYCRGRIDQQRKSGAARGAVRPEARHDDPAHGLEAKVPRVLAAGLA